MTSPPRSQPGIDDLIKMLDLHVDGVRHYLHLQIGKPLSKDLISAPEIALDNLHREMKGALRAQCGVQTEGERVQAVASALHIALQSFERDVRIDDLTTEEINYLARAVIAPLALSSADLAPPCVHNVIIGLDGCWHCQTCGAGVDVASAHSSTHRGM